MELLENKNNCIGYKIPIYPNKEQKKIFEDYFNTCRAVYNIGIEIEESYYKEAKDNNYKYKTLSKFNLNNIFTQLKKEDKYLWLNDYDSTTLKLVLFDVINAYKRFFEGLNNYPTFKKKKNYHKQFPVRGDRLSIEDNRIRIPSIGFVDSYSIYSEILGNGNKNKININYINYYNPRVIYDGCNYYLTLSIPRDDSNTYITNSEKKFIRNEIWNHKKTYKPVGIDVGCKKNNWIVDSNGNRIDRPDTSKEEKRINNLKKRLNNKRKENTKRMLKRNNSTSEYKHSKNELKLLKKLNKCYKRITNKKKNTIYEYTNKLISSKPEAVVIEDIKVEDMYIKGADNYNKVVKDSMLYTVHEIITYKCINNGIPVYKADKEYPSSQLCSLCGYRQDIGKKSIYRCPCCGNVMDRDYNASINLENLVYHKNEAVTMFYMIG